MIDLSSLSMTEIVRLQNQLQHELRHRFERSLLMAFSDIVGSTPYFARFGDAVGRQLHQLHFDLLGQAATDAQGASSTPSATACSASSPAPRRGFAASSPSSRRWRARTVRGRASTS
jgi:class 3 adenylate cyclase